MQKRSWYFKSACAFIDELIQILQCTYKLRIKKLCEKNYILWAALNV